MTKLLEGKVAIVTGGSSGIGRATALVFAREGAKVVVADVAVDGGKDTVNFIKEAGSDALFVKCDVSQALDVEAMVKKAVDAYGHLDCAFNNAGVLVLGSTADCTEEDWDRVISTNLKGVWLCMKYEIPQMLKQRSGAIVNTSSVAGLIGSQGIAAYAASKHGIVGLTKVAAMEYAHAGIRVNTVCPAGTLTPMNELVQSNQPELGDYLQKMQPMGRLAKPEEIAEAALFLCSEACSFVTGVAFPVDGGAVAGK